MIGSRAKVLRTTNQALRLREVPALPLTSRPAASYGRIAAARELQGRKWKRHHNSKDLSTMMSINDTSLLRESATPRPCYLLVVDDEALIRAEYASFFKRAGYQVHSANSGAQALMMIGVRPYQIVVTDWDMPGMDGPSLCRKIRLEEGDEYTYLMILSVRTSMADILVGLEAGADDYFVKGSPSEELLARIAAGRRITAVEHLLRASSGENRSESETDRSTEVHASSVKSSWSSCPRLRWVKPR